MCGVESGKDRAGEAAQAWRPAAEGSSRAGPGAVMQEYWYCSRQLRGAARALPAGMPAGPRGSSCAPLTARGAPDDPLERAARARRHATQASGGQGPRLCYRPKRGRRTERGGWSSRPHTSRLRSRQGCRRQPGVSEQHEVGSHPTLHARAPRHARCRRQTLAGAAAASERVSAAAAALSPVQERPPVVIQREHLINARQLLFQGFTAGAAGAAAAQAAAVGRGPAGRARRPAQQLPAQRLLPVCALAAGRLLRRRHALYPHSWRQLCKLVLQQKRGACGAGERVSRCGQAERRGKL